MPKAKPPAPTMEELLQKGAERIATMEARMRALESRGPGLGSPASKDDGFSFANVIRGMVNGGLDNASAWVGAEREREIGLASRKRALEQGTDSAGGYAVPPEYIASLIELLVNRTYVLAAGATQMTSLTGAPVEIPKLAGGATGEWLGENTGITPEDQTFGQVLLNPHMGAALTYMSRRVARMSNPAMEGIVRNDLAGAIARLMDAAALYGTGVGDVPLGIKPSITPIPAGGDVTIPALYDLLYALEAANADMGSIGFMMNPREFNTLRQEVDSSGRFYLQPDPTAATRMTLFGYPVYSTNQVAINGGVGVNEGDVFLANWADLIWGQWGGVVIESTTEGGDTFANHQLAVKVVTEVDFGIRHEESFQVLSGIIPA